MRRPHSATTRTLGAHPAGPAERRPKRGLRRWVLAAAAVAVVAAALAWRFKPRQAPKADTQARKIAALQGWNLPDTEMQLGVEQKTFLGSAPSAEEWARLLQATKRNPRTYLYTPVIDLPKVTPKSDGVHQAILKAWCAELMRADWTVNRYGALLGYLGYLQTNATDAQVAQWRRKLLARGAPYTEGVPLLDRKYRRTAK